MTSRTECSEHTFVCQDARSTIAANVIGSVHGVYLSPWIRFRLGLMMWLSSTLEVGVEWTFHISLAMVSVTMAICAGARIGKTDVVTPMSITWEGGQFPQINLETTREEYYLLPMVLIPLLFQGLAIFLLWRAREIVDPNVNPEAMSAFFSIQNDQLDVEHSPLTLDAQPVGVVRSMIETPLRKWSSRARKTRIPVLAGRVVSLARLRNGKVTDTAGNRKIIRSFLVKQVENMRNVKEPEFENLRNKDLLRLVDWSTEMYFTASDEDVEMEEFKKDTMFRAAGRKYASIADPHTIV